MNQIITKYQLKIFPVIVSMLLLLVTFKIVSVPLLSIISLIIAFGKSRLSDVFSTLSHILFVQGLARIFFNLAALKSNSIIVPWIVHVVFALTTFGLGTVMLFALM